MEISNRIYTFEEVKETYSKYIHNPEDLALIEKAYLFAEKKHEGQIRKSGDPYVSHCIGVAMIIAQLQAGPKTICAGFLHDTIEDTDTTKEDIEKLFGKEVADMVEALTKVTRLSDYKNVEFTAENHRKIFVAMAKDMRVIIVKLADRLHNMRTLQFQPKEKQIRISRETLDVYEPIAHRLGLFNIQTELENLSLWYLHREDYIAIEEKIKETEVDAHNALSKAKEELSRILSEAKIPFTILDRVKSVYSIYKKMRNKMYDFNQIYDLMALRIITDTEQDCYAILGYVHANFKPLPGRFKDYIAMPKPNMYQSLHTTIVSNTGHVFEVQIRTKEMDEIAEGGVAAHWRYKENSKYDPKVEQEEIENQLHWFKDFVSITNADSDTSTKEYVDTLSHDIFDANVYVFTPKGNVICLSSGSTPLDFAYRIHSDVGEHVQGAKINGTLVPLTATLKTGDVVEVITNKDAHPNSEWLNIAKTNFAKSKIRKYLMKQNSDYMREDSIKKGRQALLDSLRERKINTDISSIVNKKVLQAFKCENQDDLYQMISGKTVLPNQIIEASGINYSGKMTDEQLKEQINSRSVKKNTSDAVVLENGDTVMICLANCCTPIPGDDIIGFVSTGQGVKVHRHDCPNVCREGVDDRLIKVRWNPDAIRGQDYPVDLAVECHDREKLLIDIVNALSSEEAKVTMLQAKLHPSNNTTTVLLTLLAKDTDQLGKYMHILTGVKGVFQIRRLIH
jgi:GTP diphosphokinase / guanosine-3',5'-bis(diphosphate) 3'-diphosphatase